MDTIDLLLKATDKAIQLLSLRTERDRRYQAAIFDPLFTELEKVYDDYSGFFVFWVQKIRETDSRRSISFDQRRRELVELEAEVRRRRESMRAARIKLRSFANALQSSTPQDSKTTSFANSILALFASATERDTTEQSGQSTKAGSAIRLYELLLFANPHPNELIESLEGTKRELEQDWASVATAYLQLKYSTLR